MRTLTESPPSASVSFLVNFHKFRLFFSDELDGLLPGQFGCLSIRNSNYKYDATVGNRGCNETVSSLGLFRLIQSGSGCFSNAHGIREVKLMNSMPLVHQWLPCNWRTAGGVYHFRFHFRKGIPFRFE